MDNTRKNLRGAEVLITGGAGFIGSNLSETLVRAGAKVTILDLYLAPYGANIFNLRKIIKKIRHVRGDVRIKETVKKLVKGKDFVFHLAGQTGRTISLTDPDLDYTINVLGTRNVLEAVKHHKNKAKILFTSSRGVIGQPEYLPVDEKHPTNPRDFYGTHKLAAEKYFAIYAQEYGTRSTILRLNNVYGPGCQVRSNHYGTINIFVKYALLGKTIPVYGSGMQTRDYIHVDDVISALVAATATKADGGIYFIGSGKETSLFTIVRIIGTYVKGIRHELVPYPDLLKQMDFDRFYSDSAKFRRSMRWKPTVKLDEGIKQTIAYYKKHLSHYL